MLTILIADDEQHIREGIANSIDWRELQIDKVFQAVDGEQAIQIIREHKIDILLTDIRMPIVDGIQLSQRLHERSPDSIIIFMSAYSDKEYFLSAIKLGASNYIEKPIQTAKLNEVLEEAAKRFRQNEYTMLKNIMVEQNYKISMPLVKNEIALLVTNKNPDIKLLLDCIQNDMLGIVKESSYITAILKVMDTFAIHSGEKHGKPTKAEFFNRLTETLAAAGLLYFWGTRNEEEYIIHIFGNSKTSTPDQNQVFSLLDQWLRQQRNLRLFISVGTVASNFTKINRSYACAKIALCKCFYRGYGSIISYMPEIARVAIMGKEIIEKFNEAADGGKQDAAIQLLQDFSAQLRRYETADVYELRNIYCKLMAILLNNIQNYGVSGFSGFENENSLRNEINSIQTLNELENFGIQLLSAYFDAIMNIKSKNSISLIIGYIEKNYQQKDLDINQISQNMFLSPAYLCTYFKRETGKTIKQYITDYRLSKATEFLKDENFNISNIAGLVGYDANYFARIFKMKFGSSPSEYRERFGIEL